MTEVRDTTVKKVTAAHAPKGKLGQTYLVSGKTVAMRLWDHEPPSSTEPVSRRDYETLGYVVEGKAELQIEGQRIMLRPGDAWLVPAGTIHSYRILETFTAIEATSPPARVKGRDAPSVA